MRSHPIHDGTPPTAETIGMGDRFRYWRGASGRRYLFTAVALEALSDFQSGLVLMASDDEGGEPRIVWIGQVDDQGNPAGNACGPTQGVKTRAYVHLLACSDEERQAIMLDLIAGQA